VTSRVRPRLAVTAGRGPLKSDAMNTRILLTGIMLVSRIRAVSPTNRSETSSGSSRATATG